MMHFLLFFEANVNGLCRAETANLTRSHHPAGLLPFRRQEICVKDEQVLSSLTPLQLLWICNLVKTPMDEKDHF